MSKNHKHNKSSHINTGSVIAPDRIFYWAYGSNLCIRQMKRRCPRAIKYGPMSVNDSALIFRGVADVTVREGSTTPGGLWQITAECERSLDQYEGVASKMYLKRYFRIEVQGKKYTCLFYQMRAKEGVLPPSEDYLNTIVEGYRDFGLNLAPLDAAVSESWDAKHVTDALVERHIRRGQPTLARDIVSAQERAEFDRQGRLLIPQLKKLPPPMWKEEGEHE